MKQTDDSKKSGEIKKNYSQINDNLYYTPTKAREKNSPETQKKINELRNKMDELNDEIAKLKSKDIERYDHISELTIDGMTKHERIDYLTEEIKQIKNKQKINEQERAEKIANKEKNEGKLRQKRGELEKVIKEIQDEKDEILKLNQPQQIDPNELERLIGIEKESKTKIN